MRQIKLEEIVLFDLVEFGVLGNLEFHEYLVVFFARAVSGACCVI